MVGAGFLHRAEERDARIVDKDVDLTEALDTGCDRVSGLGGIRHVEADLEQAVATAKKFEGRRRSCGGNQRVAGGKNRLGDLRADATRCARNQPDSIAHLIALASLLQERHCTSGLRR